MLQRPGENSTSGLSEKTLVQYDSTAVDRIEVTSAGGTVTIEKQAGRWMLTSPVHYAADQNAVASAIGQGRSIKLNSLVSTNPEKQKIFEVDSTATLVRVFENGTGRGTGFRIGNQFARERGLRIAQRGQHIIAGHAINSRRRGQP